MKILISGTSGFIGSHLLNAACESYGSKNVIAFSSRPASACRSVVYQSVDDFSIGAGDLELLSSVELLIHAGAFTPKNGSEVNSLAGSNGNITFTERLLGLPLPRLSRILYISTVDVYDQVDLISETTPALPVSLYGQSKLYCEKMIECFAVQRNITSQVLRIGHVYGPGEEKFAKVLPTVIKNIVAGKSVELWGSGSEMRSFIFIDDVVTAILNAVPLHEGIGIINVAGSYSISIRQLIEQLISISGKTVEIRVKESNGPRRDCVFDTSKLRTHLLARETDFVTGLKIEYEHIASQC